MFTFCDENAKGKKPGRKIWLQIWREMGAHSRKPTCPCHITPTLTVTLSQTFELTYLPPVGGLYVERMQVTVLFLADVQVCLPSPEEWPMVWGKQQAWKASKAAFEKADGEKIEQVRSCRWRHSCQPCQSVLR